MQSSRKPVGSGHVRRAGFCHGHPMRGMVSEMYIWCDVGLHALVALCPVQNLTLALDFQKKLLDE